MDKVRLYNKTFKTFIPNDRIMSAIDDVAVKINKDFAGCEDVPILLCVLNGSIMFMGELMKRLDFNCQIVSIKLTSYEGTNTTGRVKQAMGLTADIRGRRVIVVEDIVDSGNTLSKLVNILKERNVGSVKTCTLLDKPERRAVDFNPDYVGTVIPDKFVVGFGLDFAEKYRNLPYVGILKPSVYSN